MALTKLNAARALTGATPVANGGTALTSGFVNGGVNTPAFEAQKSSSQDFSNNTLTKIQYNHENFDTDSAYDNSSNYRFTVPSGQAGKYFFYASVRFTADTATYDLAPYKNGSQIAWVSSTTASDVYHSVFCSFQLDLSASDYVEVYARQNSGGTLGVHAGGDTFVLFGGHKLIT